MIIIYTKTGVRGVHATLMSVVTTLKIVRN